MMKPMCEAGCGRRTQVYGCKYCPECYPVHSRLDDQRFDERKKQREKPGTTPEQLGKTLGIDPSQVTVSGGQIENFRAGWAKTVFTDSRKAHYFRRRTDNIAEATSLCGVTVPARNLFGPGNYSQCSNCLQKVQKGLHL